MEHPSAMPLDHPAMFPGGSAGCAEGAGKAMIVSRGTHSPRPSCQARQVRPISTAVTNALAAASLYGPVRCSSR